MVRLDLQLAKAAKGGKHAKIKKRKNAKPQSRSLKANLSFPVGRIHRYLKACVPSRNRVSGRSAVFLAAVLEYLVAEVVELAGHAARDFKMKRISPRHLLLAIRGDEELDELIRATISNAGVLPQRKCIGESAFSSKIVTED